MSAAWYLQGQVHGDITGSIHLEVCKGTRAEAGRGGTTAGSNLILILRATPPAGCAPAHDATSCTRASRHKINAAIVLLSIVGQS